MMLLTLLLIPTLIACLAFVLGHGRVTWQEFLGQMVAQTAIVGLGMLAIYYVDTTDHEIWGGRVAQKTRDVVHCRHSYSCNCVTVSCGKNCSHTICQTCYYHQYDVDWDLETTNHEALRIDTVDWQGIIEPPRWTAVRIGEPTAVQHQFTNYVKASPDSLFRHQGLVEKYKDLMPSYPGHVYDYYHVDRLVQVGIQVQDDRQWNLDLETLNGDIGAAKQATVAVVLVKGQPEDYAYALEQHWIGGKKNDIIAVLGTDGQQIQWAHVLAWTDAELFKVQTRDDLLNLGQLDRTRVLDTLARDTKNLFVRKHMKDFQYLTQSVVPTTGEYVSLMVLGIVVSLGISWWCLEQATDDRSSWSRGVVSFGRRRS